MSTFLPVRMMSTPAMRPARSGRPQPAIGAHRIDHDAMIRPLVLGTHAVVDDQQMTSLAVEAVMGRDAAEARLLVEVDQTFGRGIVTVGADEALVPAKHLGIDVDTSRSRRHRQERRIIDTPVLREQRGSSRRRVEAEDREANPAGRLEIGGVTVQTPYDHRDLGHGHLRSCGHPSYGRAGCRSRCTTGLWECCQAVALLADRTAQVSLESRCRASEGPGEPRIDNEAVLRQEGLLFRIPRQRWTRRVVASVIG